MENYLFEAIQIRILDLFIQQMHEEYQHDMMLDEVNHILILFYASNYLINNLKYLINNNVD
jgi:hypothetical protein